MKLPNVKISKLTEAEIRGALKVRAMFERNSREEYGKKNYYRAQLFSDMAAHVNTAISQLQKLKKGT